MKQEELLAKDLKAAVKQVVGAANSLTGVQVEGKRPKEVIKEIDLTALASDDGACLACEG